MTVLHRFLPGPFGRANGFLSEPSVGTPAVAADAAVLESPSSAMRYFSSSSEGSDVSTFRDATVELLPDELRSSLTSRTTESTALEYSMRWRTAEADGQEYIGTADKFSWRAGVFLDAYLPTSLRGGDVMFCGQAKNAYAAWPGGYSLHMDSLHHTYKGRRPGARCLG